jgi:phosphotransferase system enzyme I (PtsI)
VLSKELTPGLTVQLEQALVTGLASEHGTRTSHAAILSRSLGMPCVMGLAGGVGSVRSGAIVILDGTRGTLLVDPTDEEIKEAYEREGLRLELDRELEAVVGLPAITRDGVGVTLRGNVDLPEEVESAADHGADGVGLLRTEFLVVGRTELPGEEEQAEFYRRVGERFAGLPVVVRSYDLGGDKFPASFRAGKQSNPFLGWRAIRVCLDHPDILRTQIRALLRARATSDVRLMLPLVTQVEEVLRTREILDESIAALDKLGTPIGADLPVGVMIETPAAAMMVEQLAECSDFISVGTNDLTQYTLAVDRGNARLADRFTPLHPAVVRLLKRIVDCGVCHGIDVSVCGEMASEPLCTLLLLGLGYRVLSASPGALPLLRWIVRQIDISAAQVAGEQATAAATTGAVASVLSEHMGQYVDLDLLEAGRLPVA